MFWCLLVCKEVREIAQCDANGLANSIFFSFVLLCYHFLVEMLRQIRTKTLTSILVLLLYRNRDTKLEERGVSSGSETPAGEESGRWVWSLSVCCELSVFWTLSAMCCQMRRRCWWCGTACCRWRWRTWRDTATKESRSRSEWGSSSRPRH